VEALTTDASGRLFVGGQFTMAGAKASPFIALVNLPVSPSGGRFDGASYLPLTGFSFSFRDATLGQPYRIQSGREMAGRDWSEVTNFIYSGPVVITDPSAIASPGRLYRAVTP
jgi:hypothetical protein